jgi:hypothetical protein
VVQWDNLKKIIVKKNKTKDNRLFRGHRVYPVNNNVEIILKRVKINVFAAVFY